MSGMQWNITDEGFNICRLVALGSNFVILTWPWRGAAAWPPSPPPSVWAEQPERRWSTLQKKGSDSVTRHQTSCHSNKNKPKHTGKISKRRAIWALLAHLFAVFSQQIVKKWWHIISAHLFSSGWGKHKVVGWGKACGTLGEECLQESAKHRTPTLCLDKTSGWEHWGNSKLLHFWVIVR